MATEKRLIDANWILGEIEHDVGCYDIEKLTEDDALYVELRDVVRMVCAAPTVEAVPVVHGRWEQIGYDKAMDRISCSVCKEYWNICDNDTETFNYCPNCGAKMDGDGNG